MNADELMRWFGGSAEAVFVWAAATLTDIKSEFDITDGEFDKLKALAAAEVES